MVIYDKIKKLIADGISKDELKEHFYEFKTFTSPILENYVKQNDYDNILKYHNNMVYSYEVFRTPFCIADALFLTVNVITYDENKKTIHLFHSYECDMKQYPEDLDNIVSYLNKNGYHEIAPVELFDLQYGIKKWDKKWYESLLSNSDDINVNVVTGIPNKTNSYFPNSEE